MVTDYNVKSSLHIISIFPKKNLLQVLEVKKTRVVLSFYFDSTPVLVSIFYSDMGELLIEPMNN